MAQEPKVETASREDGHKEPRLGDLPIREHILMVNDFPRGEKYYQAMKACIGHNDVVLEVGTGAGLLSCMAARLGAKHVYTVEQSPVLARVARKVIDANGLGDRITLLNVHSKDLAARGLIQSPVDVFVTETIGRQGLDEGILTVFEDVKPLLSRKARVIPESVTFKHCLVNMTGVREQAEIMHPVFGLDMGALNEELESNNFSWMNPIEPWRQVSTTAETRSYNLLNFVAVESKSELTTIRYGICDGLWVWAEFKLGKNITLDTRYQQFGSNWANVILFMPRIMVEPGQPCTSRFRIHDDKVNWVMDWTVGG